MVLPILTHVLFLEDATITIYCIISQILCIIATLMANKPEILYVAASLGILSIMTSTPMMAWLTKLVGKNDIGKVNLCLHYKRMCQLNWQLEFLKIDIFLDRCLHVFLLRRHSWTFWRHCTVFYMSILWNGILDFVIA